MFVFLIDIMNNDFTMYPHNESQVIMMDNDSTKQQTMHSFVFHIVQHQLQIEKWAMKSILE